MHLKVAFEGCCLSGKSSLIKAIMNRHESNIDLKTIADFAQWAGGHQHFSHMDISLGKYPQEWETYFVNLDRERSFAITNFQAQHTRTLTLIDRTLLTCIELRDHIRGDLNSSIFEKHIIDGHCVIPDILVLLNLSAEDYKRRLSSRQLFTGWEIVYRRIESEVFAHYANLHYPDTRVLHYPECQGELNSLVNSYRF